MWGTVGPGPGCGTLSSSTCTVMWAETVAQQWNGNNHRCAEGLSVAGFPALMRRFLTSGYKPGWEGYPPQDINREEGIPTMGTTVRDTHHGHNSEGYPPQWSTRERITTSVINPGENNHHGITHRCTHLRGITTVVHIPASLTPTVVHIPASLTPTVVHTLRYTRTDVHPGVYPHWCTPCCIPTIVHPAAYPPLYTLGMCHTEVHPGYVHTEVHPGITTIVHPGTTHHCTPWYNPPFGNEPCLCPF